MADPGTKLDHDDPIVADNAPARFNFTTKAPDDVGGGSGKNFEREYTNFETLVLSLVTRDGDVTTQTFALAADSDIVFALVSASSPTDTEEVTFTSKKSNKLKIKVQKNKLTHKKKTPEILESDAIDDLRIAKITIMTPSGKRDLSFTNTTGFLYVSTVAVIKAAPGH